MALPTGNKKIIRGPDKKFLCHKVLITFETKYSFMNLRLLLCLMFSTLILLSCGEKQSTSTLETLIPQPVTLDKHPGAFTLSEKTVFYAAPGVENKIGRAHV